MEVKELKEVHFGDNLIVLKDNLVKTTILPKATSELETGIKFQGNVVVEGAVYGKNIEIEDSPAEIQGALFANEELHIRPDAKGDIIFRKAVASTDSIVALLTHGKALFGSDVNAVTIKLKNCFVGGSVYATDIQLENCVVLGGVFASKTLSLSNVCVGTFHSPEVNMSGINELLYPTAFSVEPIAALPQTELYNLALADLGALYKGEKENEGTGKIHMDLVNDSQKTILTDENGSNFLTHSYSVAGRVLVSDLLDMDKLDNHFLIGAGSLGTQLLKPYTLQKSNGERSEELSLENIAKFFFGIVNGSVQFQEISGTISFEDMKKNFE